MSDTINEQVSAFVDGELPDAERELLQRRLASDYMAAISSDPRCHAGRSS
jgi:anti-sigma factor RsiW